MFCIVIGGFSWLCGVLCGIASGGLFWCDSARWYGCPDYVGSTPDGAQMGITGLLFYPDIRPGWQFINPGKRKGQAYKTCPLLPFLVACLEAKINSIQSF